MATTLGGEVAIPLSVNYTPSKKPVDGIYNRVTSHCRILEVCDGCISQLKTERSIIQSSMEDIENFDGTDLPCTNCKSTNRQCFRFAVVVLCSDCEPGSKKVLDRINEIRANAKRENRNSEQIPLLRSAADILHCVKNGKATFSNWYIIVQGERGGLSIMRNLREQRSELGTSLRKLLTLEDVRHRDRQSSEAPRKLSQVPVLRLIASVKHVVHPLVPEKWRVCDDNHQKTLKNPVSITHGMMSEILILDTELEAILTARLHYPVQVKQLYTKIHSAKAITYSEGILFIASEDSLKFIDHAKVLKPAIARMTRVQAEDYIKTCKIKLQTLNTNMAYLRITDLKRVKEQESRLSKARPLLEMADENYRITSIISPARDLIFIADIVSHSIKEVTITVVGFNLNAKVNRVIPMPHTAIPASLCILGNLLIIGDITDEGGIYKLNLETLNIECIVKNNTESCTNVHSVCRWDTDCIAFTDIGSRQVKWVDLDGNIEVIAGSGKPGRSYGPAVSASLSQPVAIISEGGTLFFVDPATSSLSMITGTQGICDFLCNLGELYDAFSIQTDKSFSIDDTIVKMKSICDFFEKTVSDVKSQFNLHGIVQGPQGVISKVFLQSLHMVSNCLMSLQEEFPDMCQHISAKAITTKLNENFFSSDALEFAILFPKIVLDLLKRVTELPFVYYTGRKAYYDTSSGFLHFSDLPSLPRISEVKISDEDKEALTDYKKLFLQSVRQLSVRPQTTKSNMGTLPLYAYQTVPPEPKEMDFKAFLTGTVPQPSTDRQVLYKKGGMYDTSLGESKELT